MYSSIYNYYSLLDCYLVCIVVEVGFNPIHYTVDESDGIVILYVENRNPEIETEVTVLFDTTDGTATSKS